MQRSRGSAAAREALEAVVAHWRHTLGAVQVDTPDAALNVLTNGWLVYQTMACRLWARSGYYQSGGAYGFRDQLQDVMALVHAEPGLMRAQIALCAAANSSKATSSTGGIRRRAAAYARTARTTYLWLPLATCRYVLTTGDTVDPRRDAHRFSKAARSTRRTTRTTTCRAAPTKARIVYQHCVRAMMHGLRFGAHGLPLIGSGDWNDGMNLVGRQGKGESVWLAFFLVSCPRRIRQSGALA